MSKNFKLYDVPKIDSIQSMLINSKKTFPQRIALKDLVETPIPELSYFELFNTILKFGAALKNLNIEERTHIGIIGENRVQWAVAYLTSMLFNYVIVPIDRNLKEHEVYNIIHESEAEVVIFSAGYSEMFLANNSALKNIRHFICMDETKNSSFLSMKKMISETTAHPENELPKIDPSALAEIIFTSGSLGRAKGVMLSQKNLAANLMAMVSMLKIYPEDKFLSVLPMHHTYECTCGMLCPIYSGASVHFARSLKTVVDDLQSVKATMLLGVPLLYDKMFKRISKTISDDKVKSKIVPPLVKVSNFIDKISVFQLKKKLFKELHEKFGGSIRVFIAGGAAPDPVVAEGLRGFGFNFIQGYGLTETSPILALNRLDNFKDNAAGIPLPGVQLKINDPDPDGNGEVFAKGDNVMIGYFKNEKATNETFEDGWFKTGDIGFIDEDGFLHINGRKKNVIISRSGKNVFPEEIEDIINRSPFVLESVVYGENDVKHDEIIAAKIVPDTEAFIEYADSKMIEINDDLIHDVISNEIESVNKQLTSYKKIVRFHIQENEFEKTTTQKIKRYLIKS
ncbi:MAG: AMP-binding protein [Melioribacteraceae bacterium]|nr:AMP-binding protein [Melioribacteraceae bacterium]MCF8264006.1 AMP-binding protein [Melioribacteraceae bacterium]MCF8412572.1 AMP-binding protein [Melioribacteraceae bacterium]MCF8431039.1 AMP-binding protein [Melioribacteraceae bacterium]